MDANKRNNHHRRRPRSHQNRNRDENNNPVKPNDANKQRSHTRTQYSSAYSNHSASSKQTDDEVRLSLKKVNELIDKQPEAILLGLESPHFGIKNYLDAPRMGDELIKKLAVLFEKILSCNSMKTKLIDMTRRFLESIYFNQHLYNSLQTRMFQNARNTISDNNNNTILVRSVLNICCLILELNPNFLEALGPMKDRLELIMLRLNDNQDLNRDFEERLKKLAESIINRWEKERNVTFRNEEPSDLEPPNDSQK